MLEGVSFVTFVRSGLARTLDTKQKCETLESVCEQPIAKTTWGSNADSSHLELLQLGQNVKKCCHRDGSMVPRRLTVHLPLSPPVER